VNLFLASPPGASVVDVSDYLPDSDGRYTVGALNLGPSGATGSGILARLTLSAVGSGADSLSVGEVGGGYLVDSSDNQIAVGTVTNGRVAVGQSCP
jgi:hypothetical protein